MIFGIKQIIKMLFQQLILPVVYNACTAKPVIPGTVILADAHHDEIPFSMLAIKEELSRHPELQVLFPLINKRGFGIADGTADEMLAKIRAAHAQGQGIIAMKPLGGGHLIAEREAALDYILNLDDCIDTIAIGMQSVNEVEYNCRRFSGEKPDEKLSAELAKVRRTLLIQEWCEGCGTCVAACHNHALRIENGRAVVDQSKCALCGYCARACPQFTIKVI